MAADAAWLRLNSSAAPVAVPVVVARAAVGGVLYDAIKKLPLSRTLPAGSICVAEVHDLLLGAGEDVSTLPVAQPASHLSLVAMAGSLGASLSAVSGSAQRPITNLDQGHELCRKLDL